MLLLGGMLETGQGGVARDAGRAVELYRLALATMLGKNGPVYQRCVEGLGRLGADGGSGAERARLERARLARYDAARRGGGGRTPKQLADLAIAGGPAWDRLEEELAAAAARCDEDDADAGRAVEVPVEVPVERRVEVPVEVPVERRVEVSVERRVEVLVEVSVERRVEVLVEVPVERRVELPVEVPVERRVEESVAERRVGCLSCLPRRVGCLP
jgi:hypothetical protein